MEKDKQTVMNNTQKIEFLKKFLIFYEEEMDRSSPRTHPMTIINKFVCKNDVVKEFKYLPL